MIFRAEFLFFRPNALAVPSDLHQPPSNFNHYFQPLPGLSPTSNSLLIHHSHLFCFADLCWIMMTTPTLTHVYSRL